ncbi:hypothetical protein Bhyg_03224, partial [Pseudolycoriella hygida]
AKCSSEFVEITSNKRETCCPSGQNIVKVKWLQNTNWLIGKCSGDQDDDYQRSIATTKETFRIIQKHALMKRKSEPLLINWWKLMETGGAMERLGDEKAEGQSVEKRCVNCGGKNHKTESCPHKDKGKRCFNCNVFGHTAKQCTTNSRTASGDGADTEKDDNESKKIVNTNYDTGIHMSSWKVEVIHGNFKMTGIICTSLKDSFIKRSTLEKFEYRPSMLELSSSTAQLWGNSIIPLANESLS